MIGQLDLFANEPEPATAPQCSRGCPRTATVLITSTCHHPDGLIELEQYMCDPCAAWYLEPRDQGLPWTHTTTPTAVTA